MENIVINDTKNKHFYWWSQIFGPPLVLVKCSFKNVPKTRHCVVLEYHCTWQYCRDECFLVQILFPTVSFLKGQMMNVQQFILLLHSALRFSFKKSPPLPRQVIFLYNAVKVVGKEYCTVKRIGVSSKLAKHSHLFPVSGMFFMWGRGKSVRLLLSDLFLKWFMKA